MASSHNVEAEAAKLLHKLIQESKDGPVKLATKLYVICQHMKQSGKEQSLPYQVISRSMETIVNQHGIDMDALPSRIPFPGGPQAGDSSGAMSEDKEVIGNQFPSVQQNCRKSISIQLRPISVPWSAAAEQGRQGAVQQSGGSSSLNSYSDQGYPDKSLSSRPPPAIVPKEKATNAQPPEPALEALRITSSPPAPAFLPPKVNGNAEPALETTTRTAEQGELQGQRAPPAPAVHLVTGIPPGPATLPKENDTNTQPLELPAPEAVHCMAPAHPITDGSTPLPAAVVLEENDASSQQPSASPPVAAQVAEPEEH